MTTATKWSNIAIAIQSALAAAKTITAITKANPGVASCTANATADEAAVSEGAALAARA